MRRANLLAPVGLGLYVSLMHLAAAGRRDGDAKATRDIVDPVPEADAQEQAQVVKETQELDPPRTDAEVPEADALDQARAVVLDDEDEDARVDDEEERGLA
ncbi:MAG: hypothetical protein J2O39_00380 [Acidimicrobiales bacterium]|nr:hypothetical protein [Acidimicrobiales bacterium]